MTDLTKITTPFGLLDLETQEALQAHKQCGGLIEMYTLSGWKQAPFPYLGAPYVFRAAPQPDTPLDAPWEHIIDEVVLIAMDSDKGVFGYEDDPVARERAWMPDGHMHDLTALKISTEGINWRRSLTRRPQS